MRVLSILIISLRIPEDKHIRLIPAHAFNILYYYPVKRFLSAFSGKKEWLSPVLIFLLTALFFLLHYNVFFNSYYRPHGDFTGIHFATSYILNGVFQDFDIPLWQPYLGLGGVDIVAYLAYHPLITTIAAMAQAAASALPGSGYSFFCITFFAFLLGYCATFAFGCYLLAKDLLADRFARLCVFAMALFGTHIFFTVYSLGTGVFYLPFILLFLFRLTSGEKPALNFSGLILALGLFLSSNTSYFGQALTMLILLFGAAALLRPGQRTGVETFPKTPRASCGPISMIAASAALAAGMLALKGILIFRLPEFTSAHREIAANASYIQNNLSYLSSVSVKFFTNNIFALFENLANNQGSTAALQEYSALPRLYYGLFPLVVFFFFWRRIKSPVLPLLIALTLALFLASTNPRDGYNFVLPLMVFINPLLSISTRHLNFPVIFAAPFLILAFGLALDALLKPGPEENEGKLPPRFHLIAAGLLMVLAAARLAAGSRFPRYCAFILPISLLVIYFPARRFPKLRLVPGALALLLIAAELFIPFRNYTKTFFEPFGAELVQEDRFGPNLPGPKLRGFPSPFRHSFPYWFDDSGLITTANNYPAQNNAAFKFVSGSRPELFNLPGSFLEDAPYLRGNNERLFFVDRIIPAKSQAKNLELTASAYRKGLHRSAAVVETSQEDAGLQVLDLSKVPAGPRTSAGPLSPEPARRSAFIPGSSFTRCGSDGKHPSVKLFRAELPAGFPPYLTSNFLNKDYKDIELTGENGLAYAAAYFDVFDSEKLFQANFREQNELIVSGRPPATGLTLRWKDRLGGLGISVAGFGYNFADFTVTRDSKGLLVYMDRFHARWEATIDGKPTRIYRTNGQFKGIVVQKGKHEIKFRFHDLPLKLALLTSTLAHLFGLIALFCCAL